jgi:serine/threonine protein kinase
METSDAAATIVSNEPQKPRTVQVDNVPGYELLKELGRGGMGVVYLARQCGLNRLVALKMVLGGSHANVRDLARFKTEAEAVAQLQHPHIVQVFETGEHHCRPWFSMEYVAGGSLEKKLLGRPLPPIEAARITALLAEAIAHAHARGVLHRDLKPGNILIQEVEQHTGGSDSVQRTRSSSQTKTIVLDPIVEPGSESVSCNHCVTLKITDFGLAKQLEEGAAKAGVGSNTQAGTVLGSPSYMAPEQASGENTAIGTAVDIYALGAILYELLTGRPPFRASTAWDTIMQVLNDEPVPPTRLQPKLPKDLETICLKCLAKDAKKRYLTAAELEADLERFLHHEPIHARPIPWWERSAKAAKRHPTFAALLITAAVAVTAIIGLISVGNARLQRERDLANRAKMKAEHEHERAQKRLSMAVDAVEKLLTRTAAENWARRPELQDERKHLLEEAVKFYQSFLDQEDDDPIVRREAAKAYFRMAGVYLLMGENKQAEDALKQAKSLQESLCQQFPDEPEYEHELVKTINFLGNAELLQGNYDTSATTYEKAAKRAEALAEAFPEHPEFKVTLVQTFMSLGQYYSIKDPVKADVYQAQALSNAKLLYEKDSKPYANQLYYAATMLLVSQSRVNSNRLQEAGPYLQTIKPILDTLSKLEAPSAHLRDQFDFYRSMYAIINGFYLVHTNHNDAGEAELSRGVKLVDDLLAQRPKAFPYRMLQVNALQHLGDVEEKLQKPKEAKGALDRSIQIQTQMAKDMPQMSWLKWQPITQRSSMLVEQVRRGHISSLEKSVEELQKLPGFAAPEVAGARYNLACIYALASKRTEGEERNRWAKLAVQTLEDLYQNRFFTPPNIRHLGKDSDLDALRERDDFKKFMQHFDNRAGKNTQ